MENKVINYIYNQQGGIEYAVIPYMLWLNVKDYINTNSVTEKNEKFREFNPKQFKGILKTGNSIAQIDKQIQKMRDEWSSRNF